jgi:hypothetical protein
MILLSLLNNFSLAIENPITTLGNGESEEFIIFPSGGGYNNEFNLTIPAGAIITSAELELRGIGIQDVVNQFKHDFFDTTNNTAWKNFTSQNPPTSNPSTFISTKFTSKENTDIRSRDNTRAIHSGSILNNYPYHLFRFNITETEISTLSTYWEGYGFFNGFMLVPYWSYFFQWFYAGSILVISVHLE